MKEFNEDIFKITDELPEHVKNSLKINNSTTSRILTLFEIKNVLTVDEIIVGIYRRHNILLTRTNISSLLQKLKNTNKIKYKERGVYEKVH